MKYKVGDRVRIKSLDWYNENKDEDSRVPCGHIDFCKGMTKYCGEVLTIMTIGNQDIGSKQKYFMHETDYAWGFTDEMIECKVEDENKPKFKVGDEIISDVLQQKWKVIDVERTGYKLLSVDNSDTICGTDFKNEQYFKLVEKEVSLDEASLETDFEYDGLAYTLPDGYIFKDENGNVINAQKIVLEKKKKEYPKTYEECLSVLKIKGYDIVTYVPSWTAYEKALYQKVLKLRELVICRDAYWKIAGEEMGLGKPWEPDWDDDEWPDMYYISFDGKHLEKEKGYPCCNMILIFPIEEMRDAFKENFDPDLEICKEFL